MFNPFVWLDGILLATTQKFCDKAQRLFGITKFTFEKWVLITGNAFFWAAIACTPKPLFVFLGVWQTIGTISYVHKIEDGEARFLKDGELEFEWSHDVFMRLLSTILLGFFGVIVLLSPDTDGGNLGYFYLILCLIAYPYFSACVPRPPSKSKMRELYEKAFRWLNDVLAPVPALVPISNR